MPLLLNTTSLPIAFVKISGQVELPDVEAYVQQVGALLQSNQRFVVVVEVVALGKVDRKVLKFFMDWIQANNEAIVRSWLGLALYFHSSVARFLFSSMLLLGKFPMPYTTVNSLEDAVSWSEAILRKNGIKR